jgi:hypothetical protein
MRDSTFWQNTDDIGLYTDDIVLMAPPWRGLQYLIDTDVLAHIGLSKIDMVANPAKSVRTVSAPKRRSLVVFGQFPPLQIED